MRRKRKLKSQPRIKGVTRIQKQGALHPLVWHGIEDIALSEGRSISWVIAEIVSDYFSVNAATGIYHKRTLRRVK